jgi:hypothetical protein
MASPEQSIVNYENTRRIIHETSILSPEDTAFIDRNIEQIQANWRKNQRFRTETEMRISVLNDLKFPTPAAKYWQAVREQAVFYEQLVLNSFQFRRNTIQIAKLEKKISARKARDLADDFKLMELEIQLQEAQFQRLNIEAEAKDRLRELRLWAQLLDEIVAEDSNFNTEDVNEHQLVSYRLRFARQLQNMNEHTALGERNNLVGQTVTADRVLSERGMLQNLGDGRIALSGK